MNTAINAYTSNYESCYSRDGAAVGAGRNSRRSVREGGETGDGIGTGTAELDAANKRRMRVNRVKQT